jgi:hypothetical protein
MKINCNREFIRIPATSRSKDVGRQTVFTLQQLRPSREKSLTRSRRAIFGRVNGIRRALNLDCGPEASIPNRGKSIWHSQEGVDGLGKRVLELSPDDATLGEDDRGLIDSHFVKINGKPMKGNRERQELGIGNEI